jgi:hypothetical protein
LWLIVDKKCSISQRNGDNLSALTTSSGLSAFAIAAKYGHLDIMQYLVHEKKSAVTEITDVAYLQRALHVAMKAFFLK